jgi:hypothetical protein
LQQLVEEEAARVSVTWKVLFFFTVKVEKKGIDSRRYDPQARIKLTIDTTLSKTFSSLIILPQKTSCLLGLYNETCGFLYRVLGVFSPEAPFNARHKGSSGTHMLSGT